MTNIYLFVRYESRNDYLLNMNKQRTRTGVVNVGKKLHVHELVRLKSGKKMLYLSRESNTKERKISTS